MWSEDQISAPSGEAAPPLTQQPTASPAHRAAPPAYEHAVSGTVLHIIFISDPFLLLNVQLVYFHEEEYPTANFQIIYIP